MIVTFPAAARSRATRRSLRPISRGLARFTVRGLPWCPHRTPCRRRPGPLAIRRSHVVSTARQSPGSGDGLSRNGKSRETGHRPYRTERSGPAALPSSARLAGSGDVAMPMPASPAELQLFSADRTRCPCCHRIPVMRVHPPVLKHGVMDPAAPRRTPALGADRLGRCITPRSVPAKKIVPNGPWCFLGSTRACPPRRFTGIR
jgi:hypothetical protein